MKRAAMFARATPLRPRSRSASLALVLLASAFAAVPPLAAPAEAAQRCDILGTPGPDKLHGTKRSETICGLGGNDVLVGRGGRDVLVGGRGDDRLLGGPGADTLRGGGGRDALHGGGGDDRLHGNGSVDVLAGDAGADQMSGGAGIDRVSYARANTITRSARHARAVEDPAGVTADLDGVSDDGAAGEGDRIATDVEQLEGSSGDDVLTGNDAANSLDGGPGDDQLSGGSGDDVLIGQDGADTITGEEGSDTLSGGPADDALTGGPGVDSMDGGSGNNTCDFDAAETVEPSCRYDSDGPEVVAVSAAPASASPGSMLTITAHLRDPSGIDWAGVWFAVDDTQNDFCGQTLELVSGTSKDGTWQMECTVPATARNGTYTVTPYARDRLNNHTNVNGGDLSPARATFEVTGGTDDAGGPEVVSLTASSPSVSPGDPLTITAHLRDPSGIASAGVWFSVHDTQNDICGQALELVSGTHEDGIWQQECTVPDTARNGTYTVTPFARDRLNNYTNLNGGDLSPVRATFDVTGGSDDFAGPEVVSLSADPVAVAPGDVLTITAHLRDPSGINWAGVSFSVDGEQNDFCGQALELVSGTAEDGAWQLVCTVPDTARIGTYTVTPYARDRLNNHTNVNGGDLSPVRATFDVN